MFFDKLLKLLYTATRNPWKLSSSLGKTMLNPGKTSKLYLRNTFFIEAFSNMNLLIKKEVKKINN